MRAVIIKSSRKLAKQMQMPCLDFQVCSLRCNHQDILLLGHHPHYTFSHNLLIAILLVFAVLSDNHCFARQDQ